jgi:hypothetical protein
MSWDQLYGNVKQGVEKAANKLEQTADLASLQIKLAGAEHKMQEAYILLGRIAYQNAVKPTPETEAQMAQAVRVVAMARRAVREINEQVRKQKEARDEIAAPKNPAPSDEENH